MSSTRKLNVYRESAMIGQLFDQTPLRFDYQTEYLNQPSASAISPNLPLQKAPHVGEKVSAYFENLLPEAGIRALLGIQYQTTTIFGLLHAVGGESAGDLLLLPEGQEKAKPAYQDTSWHALQQMLPAIEHTLREPESDGIRISLLAGAQQKRSLYLRANGQPALPLHNAPSSHIIKPDIRHDQAKIWCSALNETVVMNLADALGLEVAEASYQPIIKACLIRRYDRVMQPNGELKRLHQLDLCQLAGVPSTIKYEVDGGPGLLACRRLLQQNHVPAKDLKRLLQWVFFNLYVGNHDGHAKNLSVLYTLQGEVRLAPFYDLLSTNFYSGLSPNFAFRIGAHTMPGKIEKTDVEAMARELGFKPRYVLKLARDLAQELPEKLEQVTALHASHVAGNEATLLERLQQHVLSNTRKLEQRWHG